MIGKTVSHYEIVSRLGEGGMGVVYKAYDTTLKRHVALKFLPADLTRDEAARKRFTHEAQAAAALDHPNICTVHEIGQSNGNSFIVMPLVEGESLRDKLEGGALPVDEALDLALQVGRGLSKAHGSGIVHRDIKPGNVLLTTDGQAKIVDFGLAKLATQTKLTKTGMTVGTVGYMSPEQAKGEEVDHRTDVWSLGVMLYEMLAGRLPFRGEMDAAMVYSILNVDPEPVTAQRREVPVALEDVVERALSKDTTKRYQTIDEMLAELERAAEESRLGIERKRYATLKRLKRRKRLMAGTASVLVVAIAAILVTTFYQRGQAIDSIAVIPFENLSGDESRDIFAEAVTGELITNFNRVGGFSTVISRSASMQYKDTDKSPSEIARELDVKVLVGGMIQVQGDQLRITADLIDGDSEKLLWSDTFNGQMRDILTLQGQIARSVADEVHVTLTPEERELLTVDRQVDPEAYAAYMWGNKYLEVWTPDRMEKAVKSYEEAIAIDSTFAPAYAGLSKMYSNPFVGDFEKAEEFANKALELDPTLSDAHGALGWVYLNRDWDWEKAEREMAEAERLGIDEDSGGLHFHFYQLCGYMDKAIELARERVIRNPLNPEVAKGLAFVYLNASRPDECIELSRKTQERFADQPKAVAMFWDDIAGAYTSKGLPDSSFAIAEREGLDIKTSYMHGLDHFAAAGKMDYIQTFLDEYMNWWEEKRDTNPQVAHQVAYYIGFCFSLLGDNDKAFEWMEKAYEMRSWMMLYMNTDVGSGGLDNLLEDPRLADLMRRVGMPRTNIERRFAFLASLETQ